MSKLKEIVGVDIPGHTLCCRLWGSRSHNLYLEDSDTDYAGVYVVPTRTILGLDSYSETVDTGDGHDVQFHEVGKWCSLVLKGNPTIIEGLFDRNAFALGYTDPDFHTFLSEIVTERWRFLSAAVVKQCIGYAQSQLKRLEKEARDISEDVNGRLERFGDAKKAQCGFNTKWAYHAIRTLMQAHRVATGLEPKVWFPDDDPDRAILMAIRRGEHSALDVAETAEGLMHDIEKASPWQLPDQGDKVWLSNWLVKLRLRELELSRGET